MTLSDEGLSGTTLRRPRFAELLRLARSGAVDLILTKEVSRFARNTVDALQVTRRLREQGVGVIFLSDGIDTRDNDGEFRLTIMASVAQEESRKISERTRWGQLQAMRRGVAFGNDTVYGYALRGGALTIRPEQAEVVREVVPKERQKARFTDDQLSILHTLGEKQKTYTADELVELTQIPARRVLSALTMLQVDGAVQEHPGRRFSSLVKLEDE